MGLGRSIVNWFKALGYLLTGRLDAMRESLDTNTHVVKAKFDDIIKDKKDRVNEYKEAVAKLVAQQEKKKAQIESLTEETEKLENLKSGALAKAKKTVEELKASGTSEADIHSHEDYQRCLSAFNDFSSTLEEKQGRIDELEGDFDNYGKTIADHKVQLQQLLRDLEKLKDEADETVADIITAKEEKEISDLVTGLSENAMSEELNRMRDLRQKVKANARISKELSGADAKNQEAEFLEYARKSESSSEFDALIGLGESTSESSGKDSAESEG
ncbi:MAG: hypothetical protein AAF492_29970, partial [Verrucomicrobiota bacterium]